MKRLAVREIVKRFGRKTVLEDVAFHVDPGEVVALLGENGAGKTTLLRVVSGFLTPESGFVELDGLAVPMRGPRDAAARGIGMVHQHFLLVPELTVAENVVLGREPGAGPLFDGSAAVEEVRSCAERFGLDVDPRARVADLGVAAQQRVELLKVLLRGARFLLLDEPTGLLPPTAVRELFGLVERLADEGCGVVLVTHRLREVFAVCGRAVVLRHGRVVGERRVGETDESELAGLMVGEDLAPARPEDEASGAAAAGERVLLAVEGLCVPRTGRRPAVDDVSLEIRAGEIVGLAGVAGEGQVELLEAVAGLRPCSAKRLELAGRDLRPLGVGARRLAGLGHVPEDRVHDGLMGDLTVEENLVVAADPERGFFRRGWLLRDRIRREADDAVKRQDVRPADPEALAGALSGGNQQKVLVARELRAAPRVLLAAEPARGLDFRATEAVHAQLRGIAARGGAVLVVSTDLQELLDLSDRILVVYHGRIAGEVDPHEADENQLGLLMTGAGGAP